MAEITTQRFFGEDQWQLNFDDTRDFLTNNWKAAYEQNQLTPADLQQADGCFSHEDFRTYLNQQQTEAKLDRQSWKSSSFSSALPLGRSLWQFENLIRGLVGLEHDIVLEHDVRIVLEHDDENAADLVDIKKFDTSPLWAFLYLNLKLTTDSQRKLRIAARWMNELRRTLDHLVKAVINYRDLQSNENSIRTEVAEALEPLIMILHDCLIHSRRHFDDEEFVRNWSKFQEAKVKENLELISATTKHVRDLCETSKLDQSTSRLYLTDFGLRDRILPPDGSEKAIFPVESLPQLKSEVFIGRSSDIKKIHDSIGNPKPGTISKYHIYGRRGIGKTQIALEYALQQQNHYDARFWIQCETKASLRQSFAEIALKLELISADATTNFEENLQRVLKWLRNTQKKWLLIYDNAERGNLLTGCWPLGGRGSMLLTSRSFYNFFEDSGRHGETVEVFDDEERRELFMTLLGEKWQAEHLGDGKMLSPIEQVAISTLLDKTGGLPIAISHAANLILDAEINSTRTVRSFMELFSREFEKLPERQSAARDSLVKALDTVWAISFANLSPHAKTLLSCLSFLAPDLILIDLFLPEDQEMLMPALDFCRSAAMSKGGRGDSTIQTVINPSSELRAALDELKAKGLIRVTGREISIHRTVQEAVSFQPEDLRDCYDAMVSLLYDAFPKQSEGRPLSDLWHYCQKWILHAISLAWKFKIYSKSRLDENMPLKEMKSADTFVKLLANCCWYLFEVADYDECLNLVSIARSAAQDRSSLTFSHLVNTEGVTYYELNMLGPSRTAMQQCLDIRREKLPEDHAELAVILGNLGNVETAEGNYETALEYLEAAAAIRESIGDPAAVMLSLNYMQIGRVQVLIDDDTEAYRMYQKAEGVLNKRAGANKFFAAHLHFAYGNLAFKKEEWASAAASYERARLLARDRNPFHPLVAAAWYKLGCAEFEMDHHSKAFTFLNKALDIAEMRSPGEIDGTIARIKWKISEVLLDEPLAEQNKEGQRLKEEMEFMQKELADKLGVDLRGMDEWQDRESSFDLLVPGYFR